MTRHDSPVSASCHSFARHPSTPLATDAAFNAVFDSSGEALVIIDPVGRDPQGQPARPRTASPQGTRNQLAALADFLRDRPPTSWHPSGPIRSRPRAHRVWTRRSRAAFPSASRCVRFCPVLSICFSAWKMAPSSSARRRSGASWRPSFAACSIPFRSA